MENKKNGKKLLILIIVFVLLIVGASLLYDQLGDSVENNHLATQSGVDKTAPDETEAQTVPETDDGGSVFSADAETTADASYAGAGESVSTDDASGAGESASTDDASGASESASTDDTSEQALPMAPDFTVYDGDGNPVNLSDFIGKPVILNFWASWCGPCKNEMPDFEEAYQEYGDDIHFVMVNCTDGYRETVESAKKFIADQGYTFPVYYDTDSDAAYTYGASSIPMTFFIDAEGHAVAYKPGMLDREILQMGIDMIYTPE